MNSLRTWLAVHWIVFWYVPRRCTLALPGCAPAFVSAVRRVLSRRRPHVRIVRHPSEAGVIVTESRDWPPRDGKQIVVARNAPRSQDMFRDCAGIACNRSAVSFWHGYCLDENHSHEYTVEMFDEVARTYDRATHRLSLGQDAPWKRQLVAPVAKTLSRTDVVVDIGCGTGDILAMLRDDCTRVGIDVSPTMLTHAIRRVPTGVFLCQDADAPYGVRATHVFAGYLFRNVRDPRAVLRTAHECMHEGAQLHVLDMFRPAAFARARVGVVGLWCRVQDATLGHVHGAYGYIPESILNFMTVDEFCGLASECGFRTRSVECRLFGAAHILRLDRVASEGGG